MIPALNVVKMSSKGVLCEESVHIHNKCRFLLNLVKSVDMFVTSTLNNLFIYSQYALCKVFITDIDFHADISMSITMFNIVTLLNCFRLAKHEYDTSLLDTNVPPQFTLPLVDQVRKKGSSVEFSVTGKLPLSTPPPSLATVQKNLSLTVRHYMAACFVFI